MFIAKNINLFIKCLKLLLISTSISLCCRCLWEKLPAIVTSQNIMVIIHYAYTSQIADGSSKKSGEQPKKLPLFT